jgi:hypothetical protein
MLRIMSALDYNKRMTALADMLYHGGGEICRISILLFIGLVGFALLGYLLLELLITSTYCLLFLYLYYYVDLCKFQTDLAYR